MLLSKYCLHLKKYFIFYLCFLPFCCTYFEHYAFHNWTYDIAVSIQNVTFWTTLLLYNYITQTEPDIFLSKINAFL